MAFDELATKAESCLKKKKYEDASGYFETMLGQYPDHANIAQYKLKLADTYFKDGKYQAAHELYEHFIQFYPADAAAEQAKYQSIQSMFYQTLHKDCDQTETEQTVTLCQEYLDNQDFKKHRSDIVAIKQKCNNRLIDKEIYVFNFYLRHKNYDAAHNRLKHLKSKYLATNPSIEANLLYLECKLAHKEKNRNLERKTIQALLDKYPKSEYTQLAQGYTRKSTFWF